MAIKVPHVSWADVQDDDCTSRTKASRPGRVRQLWTTYIEDGWLLECLSLGLSCSLLIALCLVLNAFDGHTMPDLGSSLGSIITLNTIVAIIGTAIQACLMYPVAECLGQLKWQWLKVDRKLEDISTFDRASRGAMGAFMMLCTIKWA